MQVLVALARLVGRTVHAVRTYGLALGSAAAVVVGVTELTNRPAVGAVIAGAFGLMLDNRR